MSPLKYAVMLSSIFVLSACDAKMDKDASRLILPDGLELPILEGTYIPENCPLSYWYPALSENSVCIGYDDPPQMVDGVRIEYLYFAELRKLGWEGAGGAANGFYFEKPSSNKQCTQRLTVAGWFIENEEQFEEMSAVSDRPLDGAKMNWTDFPKVSWTFVMDANSECKGSPQ